MLCSNPYQKSWSPDGKALNRAQSGGKTPPGLFPCGQCFNCRINKARIWQTRMYLEGFDHEYNSFVTLTYNDENIPDGFNLKPEDVTKFFKRLRKNTGQELRYYYCGEYGEQKGRPHYHIALFGIGEHQKKEIEKAWSIKDNPIGIVRIGSLTKASMRYISGYIMKGANKYVDLSKAKDRKFADKVNLHLNGRRPEFQRMSRNPGLGAKAIERVAKDAIGKTETIREIMVQGRKVFIGKFLRSKSDKVLGYDDDYCNDFFEYICELWDTHKTEDDSVRNNVIANNKQRRVNREKRHRIFNRNEFREEL